MRDFIKYSLATLTGLILFVTLGLGGLIFLIAALSTVGRESGPLVEDKSVLTLNLSQGFRDSNPEVDTGVLLGTVLSGETLNTPIALRTATKAIEAAADDDRIVALYLYGSVNPTEGSGYATLKEVRAALQAFRDSGKPIIAYGVTSDERDYYLTSVASTLVLNPAGTLEMNGFNSEIMFYAGALEKYGIGIQVLRAGRYKSAVEPFVRSSSSPENRQQIQALLTDLWGEVVTTASQSRKLSPQALQTIADTQGLLLPDQAKEAGLIDRVAYFDDVVTELQALGAPDEDDKGLFRRISLSEYAIAQDTDQPQGSRRQQIALVYLEGEIVSGAGNPGQIGGDRTARLLRDLRHDDDVKAVVLRINSPGGSATASDIIAREVLLTRQQKPVIVSMGSVAASGGYQIAAQGNQIYASPNTITGSIGVYGILPNFQAIANNNGITWDGVKTGQLADLESVSRPKTDQELAIEQRIVDQFYDNFLDTVATSRSLSRQQVANVAEGRVWSGAQAETIGLVDELGGLEAAIEAAAQQANLKQWRVEEYPKRLPLSAQLLDQLRTRWATEAESPDLITLSLQRLQDDVQTLQSFNDPIGLYTRLPFNLHID